MRARIFTIGEDALKQGKRKIRINPLVLIRVRGFSVNSKDFKI